MSPCGTGGAGKRGSGLLGSCIARTTSEEDLHALEQKRPISPGHRAGGATAATTWNARNRFPLHSSQEAEDAGFDEHYFRRRPKSFCVQAASLPPGLGPPGPPPGQPGQPGMLGMPPGCRSIYGQPPPQQMVQPPPGSLYGGGGYGFVGGSQAEQASLHLSMGSLLEEQMMQRAATPGSMVRVRLILLSTVTSPIRR